MPVEIRELHIKGSVQGSGQIEKRFEQQNSPLLNTQFINQLKNDIITECIDKVMDKLERSKSR